MGLKELYAEEIKAETNGIPFEVRPGVTVGLLPWEAPALQRLRREQARRHKELGDLDWREWPDEVVDGQELERLVAAIAWWDGDGLKEGGKIPPCTPAKKRELLEAIHPFRVAIAREMARRRLEETEAVAARGKDSRPSSGDGSSTPTGATSDAPSASSASPPRPALTSS